MDTIVKDFPRTAKDITPSWLSLALKTHVISFDKKIQSGTTIGELTSIVLLYNIIYTEVEHGCELSYAIKMHTEGENRNKLNQQLLIELYKRETYFYKYLQHQIQNINTPKIFGIWEDVGEFCILMEDLTLRWKSFESNYFPSEHVYRIAEEISKLHKDSLGIDLSCSLLNHPKGPSGDYEEDMIKMADIFPKFTEAFSTNQQLNNHSGYKKWIQFWENLIVNNKLNKLFDKIQAILLSHPQFLIHGDLHHDNIWWREKDNDKEIFEYLFFDFQTIRRGPIGIDLPYFFTSCPRETNYLNLIQILSINSSPKEVMNDTLLQFILYATSLVNHLSNQIKNKTNCEIPHNFWVVLDIFDKFEMILLVESILDESLNLKK
jgi:5-methylthioribose kinase